MIPAASSFSTATRFAGLAVDYEGDVLLLGKN
jgi:hypothetical protein